MNDSNHEMLEFLPIGVIRLKEDGELLTINKHACNLLGKQLEDLKGKNVLEIFQLDQLDGGDKDFSLDNLVGREIELEFVRPDIKLPLSLSADSYHQDYIWVLKDLLSVKRKERSIRKLQDKIMENAYRDGVAENAISVLHNIGNILTTIVGKTNETQNLKNISMSNRILEQLIEKLEKHFEDGTLNEFLESKYGKSMVPMMKEMNKHYKQGLENMTESNSNIKQKCMRISDIIQNQQKYADFGKTEKEKVGVREMVSDCLGIQDERLQKYNISCELDIDINHQVMMEKVGLAQTMTNLIVNAIDSMVERHGKDPLYNEKKLKISSISDGEKIRIMIVDNGRGIEKGNLNKLFKFGFSTKERSSGFGLHNCSNYMRKNEGEMTIESDGLNCGAKCSLICPGHEKQEQSEKPIAAFEDSLSH